ncbi:MAG: AAA family ATPase, partial [Chitinivibrionales bacterium]|nr:AAA family ATPase [Chitinivibrionales bacterium]MBD3394896.1 AAA family ATPase [Chitinivibrionales bacterium]
TYLAIEGVIGVGKTSLCNRVAYHFNARAVLERAEENPFLTPFYKDRTSYALQTQLWFLLSRFKQLSETFVQQDLFQPATVSDYMFAKDKIFASLNLDENERALHSTISRILEPAIPQPDFVIYLQASTDVLLKRIEKRGRPYEYNIDPAYIDALNQAYNHFFFHYTSSPLLIINSNDIDFVNLPRDFEDIMDEVAKTKSGSNYYHPLGSQRKPGIDDKKGRAR